MATTYLTQLEPDGRPFGVQATPERALESENSVNGEHDPPATAVSALERWNYPRHNIGRLLATFWSFIVSGANDAAYGALIPYLESYYDLTYTIVSLVFLSPLGGYVLAALFNHRIHNAFGQRGVALLAPGCHLIAYIVNSLHPSYPVLVVSFIFAGFGNGLTDSAWNAWIGNMARADEILGFLHGFYGVGAVLSPLAVTSLITNANCPWYYFYYIMIACAAVEVALCTGTFWKSTGAVFRQTTSRSQNENHKGGLRHALFTYPSSRVTWLCALFLLGYIGIEVALGGWIVTFMTQVRGGPAFASGMTATGFWLGITVGRVALGFVTPRVGENLRLDLHSSIDCVWAGPMASPPILCLCRGRGPSRLLPGPIVPSRRGGNDETPATAFACELDRICCRIWRGRRGRAPLCRGGYCPVEGGEGAPAIYSGVVRGDPDVVAGTAAVEQGAPVASPYQTHSLYSIP